MVTKIKSCILIFTIILVISYLQQEVHAQPRITNTQTAMDSGNVIITYDIVGHQPGDIFKIWVDVKTDEGKKLNAKTLTGAIGDSIFGGKNKRIIWYKRTDGVIVDKKFYVKVLGLPMGSVAMAGTSEIVNNESNNTVSAYSSTSFNRNEDAVGVTYEKKEVNLGKAMLYSTLLPGLGLSQMEGGTPYWILGVAAYGCLGASIYYNRLAVESYDDYRASEDITDRLALTTDWQNQNRTSKIFAVSAVAIWAIDYAWVLIKGDSTDYSDYGFLRRNNSKLKNVSIGSTYNPLTGTPEFMVRYKF